MKKVVVLVFLLSLVLLPGCGGANRTAREEQIGPATAPGRSYFWDKDMRPTMAIPAEPRPQAQMEPMTPVFAQPPMEPVARTEVEPIRRQPVMPAEMMTSSVQPYQPARPQYVTPTYEPRPTYPPTVPMRSEPVPARTGMVTVTEAEGHVLSMLYPRRDYGIIQVDKVMPAEVRLNTPFAYVIKVTNLTEMMLTEITVTEVLAKDFEFRGSEPTALTEGDRLIWAIDSLGPKASKSIRISGIATGAKQLEYCTAITHTVRDCATVNVVEPMLELTKIAPPEAILCEAIPVEFIVSNTGTGTAQNVQIIDTLPAGMQTADGKGKVVLDAGTLTAGETRRFSIKLRATKVGAYANKAIATSSSGLQAESEATMTNVRQPSLALTKSGPKRQYLGRPVTYQITVLNTGDGPAQNTLLEDIIPPGVTSIEATAGAQFSGSKLVWDLGTLPPNTSKKVQVSYTPTREGDVLATATASAYCAEPVSDSARTVITGIAASRVEVIDLEDPIEVGSTTTYVITVANEGSAADSNVRIVCVLDDKLQYVSSAGATAGSAMGNTISFAPLRSLEPKTKATWRVVVRGTHSGDVLFRTTMHTDRLALPVEQTVATHIYQQFANGN